MAEREEETSFMTLAVEVTPQQKIILSAAAATCDTTLEQFVLKAAIDTAEQTVTV